MNFRVRPATNDDFEAIYEMAKLTGGGFTNLPADRGALVDKLLRSESAFTTEATEPSDEMFMMVLENVATGQIRGTCQIFGLVGVSRPFNTTSAPSWKNVSGAIPVYEASITWPLLCTLKM